MNSPLSYETFISDGVARAGDALLPSGERMVSSPITSTLVPELPACPSGQACLPDHATDGALACFPAASSKGK